MSPPLPLRLGLIADTHGLYDSAVEEHFAGVTEILHAGDIGPGLVVAKLTQIAPVIAVSGNVDEYERSGWPRHIVIERNGIRIGIRHVLYEKGKLTKDAQNWLDRERLRVCIFGHSHRPTIAQYGSTLLVNPGSAGPRRFCLPRGIGVLWISGDRVTPTLISLPDRVGDRAGVGAEQAVPGRHRKGAVRKP
jgi:putative phosphoesterase